MKSLDAINIWNRSCDLAVETAKVLKTCDDSEICKLTSHSAFGIATTIAAGYECDCEHDVTHHLVSAKASCAVLRTQLYIADELGVVNSSQSRWLIKESLEIPDCLQALITSFRSHQNCARFR